MMSNDKMREEFEEWVWNKYSELFWYDLERSGVLKPYGGGYQTEFLNVRWEAWQASRAAVPDMNAARTTMRQVLPDVPGDLLDHALFGALESAGLKVNP